MYYLLIKFCLLGYCLKSLKDILYYSGTYKEYLGIFEYVSYYYLSLIQTHW